jgi:hypothetical protein
VPGGLLVTSYTTRFIESILLHGPAKGVNVRLA